MPSVAKPELNFIRVSSPSRIHFGLMSVGDLVPRRFGGIGVMVQHPRTVLRLEPSIHWQVKFEDPNLGKAPTTDPTVASDAIAADLIAAIEQAAQRWRKSFGKHSPLRDTPSGALRDLPISITVEDFGPRHQGVGSGTQLAIATGIALQAWHGLPQAKSQEMASAMHRAARSAIGTYGAYEGGFLLDGGKSPGQSVGQVDLRLDFPDWPILLVFPPSVSPGFAGLHGPEEIQAFANLPPTTPDQFESMRKLIRDEIITGMIDLDYDRFAKAILDYGQRSGGYFREVQGGVYANTTIADTISILVDGGTVASGQTSWGPCVFAIDEDADRLRRNAIRVVERFPDSQCIFTSADNSGANVTTQQMSL